MSKELLRFLNGTNQGRFHEYLENLNHEPCIAWYPSAGEDFKALLYLSPQYAENNPSSYQNEFFPDIFLFTDYMPYLTEKFLDLQSTYNYNGTNITLINKEELPESNLSIDLKIVYSPRRSILTGKVLFLEFLVQSDASRGFVYPVIYAFVENEAFCSKVLLPKKSKISNIVHVRYGGGCGGGGLSSGIWLLNVLERLSCKIFITDGHFGVQSGDEAAFILYPNLRGNASTLKSIRTVISEEWSGHGDVTWNLIK